MSDKRTIWITPTSVAKKRKDRRLTLVVLAAAIIGNGLLGWAVWAFLRGEGVW